MTSGLPHDSRDADERREERHLRDLLGRVKAARTVIETTPGLAEILASDPGRAAMFYARFGVTGEQVWKGVPGAPEPTEAFDHAPGEPLTMA